MDAAGELKYLSQIKKLLEQQFDQPEEEFVKFFASRVYDGVLTAKVKAQFSEITGKALKQFLNDSINERLKSAIDPDVKAAMPEDEDTNESIETTSSNKSKIVTTEEEVDGFNIVKAIIRQKVSANRIAPRDTQSYFGVLLDDNNRKPLCRFHFNTKQKYLGIIDENKKETRHPIDSIDDIFNYHEQLLKTVDLYQ